MLFGSRVDMSPTDWHHPERNNSRDLAQETTTHKRKRKYQKMRRHRMMNNFLNSSIMIVMRLALLDVRSDKEAAPMTLDGHQGIVLDSIEGKEGKEVTDIPTEEKEEGNGRNPTNQRSMLEARHNQEEDLRASIK
ncbi:hypothetical protein FDECE_1456 [Fusarium decemcellulare]|nr:hypothetical protein FDECE_1456 [Fusarium decemcellulare]